mmetsp:Transcript_26777/g.107275  ORF Transcript_26777/g.107275 Transcript_26777/m.107275 type:complete len:215 (+) Transcript_26777:2257-2901(+)
MGGSIGDEAGAGAAANPEWWWCKLLLLPGGASALVSTVDSRPPSPAVVPSAPFVLKLTTDGAGAGAIIVGSVGCVCAATKAARRCVSASRAFAAASASSRSLFRRRASSCRRSASRCLWTASRSFWKASRMRSTSRSDKSTGSPRSEISATESLTPPADSATHTSPVRLRHRIHISPLASRTRPATIRAEPRASVLATVSDRIVGRADASSRTR